MQNAEPWLKALLRLFGGVSVIAIFPFVMPQEWMALVHAWLGMGELPDKPVVEYLARTTSALCALYGGLLLLLATDVRRYHGVIRYQAGAIILLSSVGAYLGLRAGMPRWWMIADLATCWILCGAMLFFQNRIADSNSRNSA
jgi:hypothetical protein